MVQITEDRECADGPALCRLGGSSRWRVGDLVLPTLVGPVLIEGARVFP